MIIRNLSMAALSLLAAVGYASGTTSVTASAGSVAGIDTTSPSGNWTGFVKSAQTAVMNYNYQIGSEGFSQNSNELKFYNNAGQFGAHLFDGVQESGSDGSVTVTGGSTITNSSTAPTYYQASWTSTVKTANFDGAYAFSGTYDPWQVRYSDIRALGTPDLGTADLYYQSSLLGGFQSPSGFDLAAGGSGSYTYSIYLSTNTSTIRFIDIKVNSDLTVDVQFQQNSGFDVYLLGSNANNRNATPTQRVNATDASLITSSSQLESSLLGALSPTGALVDSLHFGIVYRGYVLQPSTNPDEVLLTWHTDTKTDVELQAVPEPASMIALGAGAVAVLRRRRK